MKADRPTKIPLEWFHGLENTDEFEKTWRNSTYVLDQLKGIIERELDTLYLDLDIDYANPNWGVVRADKNGRIRALERIHKLLP